MTTREYDAALNEAIVDFFFWERASRDTIDFKKIYVDIAGSILGGLMLSEIVYWHLPDRDGNCRLRVQHDNEYWIAVRRYEWWDRARITPREADTILANLVSLGIIEKRIFKFNGDPTSHVRIIWDTFLDQLIYQLENPPQNPWKPIEKGNDGARDSVIAPNVKTESRLTESPVTETTPENTSKENSRAPQAPHDHPYQTMQEHSVAILCNTNTTPHGERHGESGAKDAKDSKPIIKDITDICSRNTVSCDITDEMIQLLETTVDTLANGVQPSPADEKKFYPRHWSFFIDHIEKTRMWQNRFVKNQEIITVDKVVSMIREYEGKGGWLDYRPSVPET